MEKDKTMDVLIVGAGIAGLLAARTLQAGGRSVRIAEKGRGVSGRMSTRYAGDARFDHGAQYFSAKSERFAELVQGWVTKGLVQTWFYGLEHPDDPEKGHPRFVGVNGMNRIAKHLAEGLPIDLQMRIDGLAQTDSGWMATAEDGTRYESRWLLLTPPVPQSLPLLEASGVVLPSEAVTALQAIAYDPCICAMVTFDGDGGVPGFGGVAADHPDVAWIADNRKKGSSPVPAVTIHSTGDFAREHWESENDVRGPLLVEAVRDHIEGKVAEVKTHRWKYSQVVQGHPEACYVHLKEHLALAGDGFGGARVEGAALSGLTAADVILGNQ